MRVSRFLNRLVARGVAAIATAALAVACSSDRTTGPASTQPLDVGSVLGSLYLPSFGTTATAGTSAGAVVLPSGCAYQATTQSFACPTQTHDGLTFSEAFTLYDATGKPQQSADRATTASIRLVMAIAGTMTVPATGTIQGGTVTIDSHQDMTVSGLLAGKLVENGTGTTRTTSHLSVNGTTSSTTTTITQTTTNVALPPTGSATHWPLSGAVAMDLTTSLDATASAPLTTHMVMTYNGTSTVTVTITSGTSTQTCRIDLAAAGMLPVCG